MNKPDIRLGYYKHFKGEEWGMGNGEQGIGNREEDKSITHYLFPLFALPITYSLFPLFGKTIPRYEFLEEATS